MSFDISKYCHIEHVMAEKGKKSIEFAHSGINLFYVDRASCTVSRLDTRYTLTKGDIICCGGKADLDISAGGSVYGLNITGIIAERYAKEVDVAFVTKNIFVPFLPQQMIQVVENFSTMSDTYISNISFEMINTLSHSDRTAVIANQAVVEAIKLINENYASSFGVDQLAGRLKISKSHLVREFQKNTGTTPGKYLINVRIDAVKQLLVQTSLPLNTIALQTGFSGDNYLCKAFKKVTGETPMSYRDRMILSQYLPNQLTLQVDPDLYMNE